MEVIFDVRTNPFASWLAFAPLAILQAALLFELFRRRREFKEAAGSRERWRVAVYLLAVVVTLLLTGLQFRAYSQEKADFVSALADNRARVVEGEITDYTPQAWTGKPLEKFQLGADRFSFDGFGASPAYHVRARSGGRLRNGMRVRLLEYQGNILRIEILSVDSATVPDNRGLNP